MRFLREWEDVESPSEHVSDDLPRLLSGEATREETLAAAHHLRHCPDCQHELDAAVVAHASLTSARRVAPERDARALSASDAATPKIGLRLRRRALLVAAAAVVVTGAGVCIAGLQHTEPDHRAQPAPPSFALAAYDVGTQPARVTLPAAGTLRIDASALPRLDGRQFYEVWLTDPSRRHLQAVGSLGAGNQAVLTVSPNVMARYSAIEVSIQGVTQTSFSGTSVLRGSYH